MRVDTFTKFTAKFPVILIGSRYLNIQTAESDWDFLCQMSDEAIEFLSNFDNVNLNEPSYLELNKGLAHQVASFYSIALEGYVHIIFSHYVSELFSVYKFCLDNQLFTKETPKEIRIKIFELLCEDKRKEIITFLPSGIERFSIIPEPPF